MKSIWRWGNIGIKLLLVPVLLVVLLREMQAVSPGLLLSGSFLGAGALSLLVNQLALLAFAQRFRTSLAAVGFLLTPIPALRIHLQSVFYFFVVPMTVGMEAARLMKLASIDKAFSKVGITAGLLLDRMIGVVPAALFFLASLPWIDFETVPGVNGMGIALAVVAVGTVLALVMAWFWRERLRALASQVRWTAIPWVAVWSLPTHLLFILAVGLVAMAVSPDTGMFEVLFVVSAANLLLVVPVSFAGAGFAEAGSLGLWLSLGTPVEAAVVLSFIPYALRVIAAIQGAVWEVAEGGIALLRTPE